MMDDEHKIEILFKEYESLRGEIMTRMTSAFGHWTFAGAVLAYWAALQVTSTYSAVLLGVAVAFMLAIWIGNELATRAVARRVAEIEQEINALAGVDLLRWESRHGAVAKGYFGNLFRK